MTPHDAFLRAMVSTIPPLVHSLERALPLLGMKTIHRHQRPATLMLSITQKGTAAARIERGAQRSPTQQEHLNAILPRVESCFYRFAQSFALLPTFAHPFYRPTLRHIGTKTVAPEDPGSWSAYLSFAGLFTPVWSGSLDHHPRTIARDVHHLPSSAWAPGWRINNTLYHARDAAHALALHRALCAGTAQTLPVVSKVLDSHAIHHEALALLRAA